jgi:hypothetical protein
MIDEAIMKYEKGELIGEWEEIPKEDWDITLDNVLSVLRGLRENHDYYLKYEESGRFFIREMELRRRLVREREIKGVFSGWGEWLLLTAYKLLSLYGESCWRPILWALVTILLFTLFRIIVGLWQGSSFLTLQEFLDELRLCVAVFFQLKWDENILTLAQRLTSIPVLGSLYISLRRKLERRIRH